MINAVSLIEQPVNEPVLSHAPGTAERKELPFVISDAVDAVTGVLERGWERTQNAVNADRKSRNSS